VPGCRPELCLVVVKEPNSSTGADRSRRNENAANDDTESDRQTSARRAVLFKHNLCASITGLCEQLTCGLNSIFQLPNFVFSSWQRILTK